ncbi:MAG TPA: hypothetical protein VF017_20370 [Thermoanaerobaculia bacterium]|nr:hypothetical protein [Thermoanaerobaculia bacterium]
MAADLRALFALERRRQHVLFGYQLWLKCLHTSSIVQLVVTGSVSGIVIELVLDAVERAGSWRGMSAEALLGLVLLVAPVVAGTVHFVTALRRTGQRFKAAVRRLDGEIAEQRRRVAEA